MLFVLSLVPALKQQFNELINEKIQTNRDQKLNLLFLQWHDQSQKFWIKLVENSQKHYKGIDIYYIRYIAIKKIVDCQNVLCICFLIMQVDVLKKQMEINTSFLTILLMKINGY